jgi:hypothetical protein
VAQGSVLLTGSDTSFPECHVSLLAKGSVSVSIDNQEPKVFKAPTFIVIKKNHTHQVTALEDDTSWYCVFAVRDIDGEVTDIVHPDHLPWFAEVAPDDFWEKRELLEKITIEDTK